jgi:hypothetical protein
MIVRESRNRAIWPAEGDPVRSRLGITAQVIGVGVLGAIVYLAFLSPNDSGPLTGIDVEPPGEHQPPERHANKNKGKKPTPKPDRPRPVVPVRTPSSVPIGPSVIGPSVVVAPTADSPAESQYTGTVARILDAVRRARN